MMIKCIYCLEDKPETSYRKTEHVIPQSFGVFKNNFTLNKVVCDDCNKYFGDNLEIDLARDTYEGHSRFEFNVKKPNDYKSYGKKSRIIIRIAEGLLKGTYAYREYSPDSNEIVLKPIPQVGFKKRDSDEYEYYLLDEIPDKEYLEKNNFDMKHTQAIKAFGIDVNQPEQKLKEKNISFKLGEEIVPPDKSDDLLCDSESEIDRTIFRAIAKIAFNYFALWQTPEFLHQKDFDNARKYIRYGESGNYPIVRVIDKAILADEPSTGKRRLGHLITVNWAGDNLSIVSQVSLFNWVTYVVSLARNFSGEHINIKNGHFFNTNSQEIYMLETR